MPLNKVESPQGFPKLPVWLPSMVWRKEELLTPQWSHLSEFHIDFSLMIGRLECMTSVCVWVHVQTDCEQGT